MTMMIAINRMIKSPTMLLLLALGTALMLATGVSAQYPQVGEDDYDGCRNPRGEPGRCISIYECASIIALMKRPGRTTEDIRFVQQSGCGFEGNEPKVCCANSASVIPINNGNGNGNGNNGPTDNRGTGGGGSNNDLLPRNCGDASSNDKIVGGQKAGLDEFPWMALLEYKKPRGMQTACGGVLISRRYVLTAAHCIVKGPNTVPTDWNLVNIRLGEYNTKTNPDCIPDGPYNEVCNEPLTNVPVEEEIVHEDYVPSPSSGYKHDIALVRLARDVEFTPFVKPICMPESADLAEVFFISGWGQTEFKSSSESKLKATIGPADRGSCEQQYKSYGITIGDGQICAGGQRGVDSCKGDSGGPLMKLVGAETANPKWVVQGVVSFGPSPCGQENWAGIYTNVWKYKDWILSKMRP